MLRIIKKERNLLVESLQKAPIERNYGGTDEDILKVYDSSKIIV